MSALSRFCPDEFTIAMLSTIVLASLLPCRSESAGLFEALTAAAIGKCADAAALSWPPVTLHLAVDRAGVGCVHLDRRGQCPGGALQCLGIEHNRHVRNSVAGRFGAEVARRVLVERAAINRSGDAASVHR